MDNNIISYPTQDLIGFDFTNQITVKELFDKLKENRCNIFINPEPDIGEAFFSIHKTEAIKERVPNTKKFGDNIMPTLEILS